MHGETVKFVFTHCCALSPLPVNEI